MPSVNDAFTWVFLVSPATRAQKYCSDCHWATTQMREIGFAHHPLTQVAAESLIARFGATLVNLHIGIDIDSEDKQPAFHLPRLKTWSLDQVYGPMGFLKSFASSPLRSLKLSQWPDIEAEELEVLLLSKLFPQLQELDVQYQFDWYDHDWPSVRSKCEGLGMKLVFCTPPSPLELEAAGTDSEDGEEVE